MKENIYGAVVERGKIIAEEDGKYRVESITRDGITSLPLKPMGTEETYMVDDLVYFFMFPDGDGLIIKKMQT